MKEMRLKGIHYILKTFPLFLLTVRPCPGQVTLVPLSQTNNGGFATAVVISGSHAFLANGGDGIRVYNVSDPTNPINVCHRDDGGNADGLALSGHYLFLANDYDGLRIYDISDPTNLVNIGHSTNISVCHSTSVTLEGSCAVQADVACGLRICDVSDPNNPAVICASTPVTNGQFYGPVSVAAVEHYVCGACFLDGLHIYDMSNPAQPVLLSRVYNGGIARGIDVSGNYAYLANDQDGLRIYDISDPTNPANIGYAPVDVQYSGDWSVKVIGEYAFVGNDTDGIHIYDVSSPANPVEIGTANIGLVRDIAVSGNYLYAANDSNGLRIFSFGTANLPQLAVALKDAQTVVVSWPATPANFALQQNGDVSTSRWTLVTNAPAFLAGQYQVELPLLPTSQFFRLTPVH